MIDFIGLSIALLAAYAYALALGKLLLLRPALAGYVRWVAILTLFFPLVIAPEPIIVRALAEVVCLDICLKVVDYARLTGLSWHQRNFREYSYLLLPFPIFLAVLAEKKRLTQADRSLTNLARIALGAGGVAIGFAAVLGVNQWGPMQQSFLLDHLVKIPIFLFTVECGSRMLYGVERLFGFDTTPLVKNVFLSLTVAEFWLRWNNRVHRWLGLNLFRPAARRFGRAGGVVAVFGFSGLFHEISFDVATQRVDGYQLMFFFLQAPMVLLSEYFARRRSIVARSIVYVLTVLWMTATSMLFLRGVERVFPFFYASQPWLP